MIQLAGKEWLFFKPFNIDVCFLRGTTADEDGNVTMEEEAVFGEMLSMAQATRRCGGLVIVQVKRLAARRTLPAKQVKIPGILVDLVVVDPEQRQSYLTAYSPAFAGELAGRRSPSSRPLPLDPRKVIARRAALELYAGAICNLGSGISTGIAPHRRRRGNVLDDFALTNEQGSDRRRTGHRRRIRARATNYDGARRPAAISSISTTAAGSNSPSCRSPSSMPAGNVNVSRFADKRIIGIGGFVNISQNAKKVIFSGTFTAGGLRLDWPGERQPHPDRGPPLQAGRDRAAGLLQRALWPRARPERALCDRARGLPALRQRHRDRGAGAGHRSRARHLRPYGIPAAPGS